MNKTNRKPKKKNSALRLILLALLTLAVIAALVFVRFGGFDLGESADAAELAACAGTVEDITLPDTAEIIALGEATHGNVEFQQLKLGVFRHLVENCGVRAFALEGDMGGCEQVNQYIHGGEGTAREAAAAIGFAIYRTEEMAELIEYMREYNDSALPGEDLRFYGFDMQRCMYNIRFLVQDCATLGIDVGELEKLTDGEDWSADYDTAARVGILSKLEAELVRLEDSPRALQLCRILLQNCALQTADSVQYGDIRDGYMAENVKWIAAQERELGFGRIFVSGHNGHVGRFGYDNMGKLLSDELGKGYYVIGTDFMKTRCNLPGGENQKRAVHTFYSHDPLANAAAKAGLDICYLDFSAASENEKLASWINDYNYMGSLGEGYSLLIRVLPPAYRIFQCPATLYDAMIFVAEASPTVILPAGEA